MNNEKIPKNPKIYLCEYCHYSTISKKDYNKHLSTDKHIKITNNNKNVPEIPKIPKTAKLYDCICGNTYKFSSGLSAHKKKCKKLKELIGTTEITDIVENSKITLIDDEKEEKQNNSDDMSFKQMFLEMVNQNKELQKTIIEQNKTIQEMIPKIGNNNNSINTNNTNNIIVNNLTLLNDNCKDALSMNEFIDSIEVEVKDLINTSEKGLTNGVANLFLENYNKLPLTKRPLWCSDKKRKKLYIKEDEWQEDKNQLKTKNAIKSLTSKQAKNSNKYIKENPDWMKSDSKKERFIHIVKETTEDIDDGKQVNIINNLLDKVHLSEDVKTELQKLSNKEF